MFLLLGVDGDDEGGNLPSSIKPVKGEPPITKFDGDIMVMRWNDVTKTKSVKIFSMLSTIHTIELVDSGKVNRE